MSPEASTIGGNHSVEELRLELAEARKQQGTKVRLDRSMVACTNPTIVSIIASPCWGLTELVRDCARVIARRARWRPAQRPPGHISRSSR